MKKYKLPPAFQIHIDSDPGLQQLKQDGEDHNRPESEFYKAALAYTLDTRRNLLIELGRYIQKYGALEPLNYETGEPEINEPEAIKTEEKVSEEGENKYPPLRELPKPDDSENKIRFSKSYE